MARMLGWDRAATALASRSNRARRSGSYMNGLGSTLMATSRSSRVSRARYTSPMPPEPSGAMLSDGPSRVEAASIAAGSYGERGPRSVGRVRVTDEYVTLPYHEPAVYDQRLAGDVAARVAGK